MARIEKVTYQCDVCKKEFKNEKDVKSTTIPCYGGEQNEYLSECSVDLCAECASKLRKVIYDNFAEINNYHGLNIRRKEKNT